MDKVESKGGLIKILRSAVLAGIFISVGGVVNLKLCLTSLDIAKNR